MGLFSQGGSTIVIHRFIPERRPSDRQLSSAGRAVFRSARLWGLKAWSSAPLDVSELWSLIRLIPGGERARRCSAGSAVCLGRVFMGGRSSPLTWSVDKATL